MQLLAPLPHWRSWFPGAHWPAPQQPFGQLIASHPPSGPGVTHVPLTQTVPAMHEAHEAPFRPQGPAGPLIIQVLPEQHPFGQDEGLQPALAHPPSTQISLFMHWNWQDWFGGPQ
jgi:hypothetical protein